MIRRLAALLTLAAAGCDPGVEPLEPTGESLQRHVFKPVCAVSGCHAPPAAREGVDFSTLEATLASTVGVPPGVGSAVDFFPAIIVPGDPDASFLVAKITHPGLDRGLPMPPTDEMLTDEAVEAIRLWIAEMPR